MQAFTFYSNAAKFVMGLQDDSDGGDPNYLVLLHEALNPLRFYMSCRVCNEILQNPMSPDHTVCQHTVCENCIGGKMKLKPSCGWCQSYENFVSNKSLSALVKCYSRLCKYIINSATYRKHMGMVSSNVSTGTNTAVECKEKVAKLVREGSDIVLTQDNTRSAKQPKLDPPPSTSESPTSNAPKIQVSPVKLTPSSAKRRRQNTDLLVSIATSKSKASRNLTSSLSDNNETESSVAVASPSLVVRGKLKKGKTTDGLNTSSEKVIDRKRKRAADRRGCGCGITSQAPGKLTCYGQRCPCYSAHNPCIDCRCRGCRNPNKIIKIEHVSDDDDTDVGEINVE